MRAGGRPYFVSILRATETRDAKTNQKVKAWNPVGEAWVAVQSMRGSENYTDGAQTAARVVRVIGDSMELADVTTADRVSFENGMLLDVTAVLPGPDPRADILIEGIVGDGVRP